MAKKERGRVERVESGKYVDIITESGEKMRLPVRNPAVQEKVRRKEERIKIGAALQALLPIKRDLAYTHEGGVDQDSYFIEKEESSTYKENDYRDRYRHACAVLMGCEVGAQEAAEALLGIDRNLDMNDLVVIFKVSQLRDEIVRYYPSNFPKNSVYPRK